MESPTHVGNTRCHRTMRWRTSVHPHACGEYGCRPTENRKWSGSSPRVWGIHDHINDAAGYFRFIPTRVGNTFRPGCGGCFRPVHPHACGEYGFPKHADVGRHGSSPRVWGIRGQWRQRICEQRFIPTRVGNTHAHTFGRFVPAVHPHACGEYFFAGMEFLLPRGSSPRVWGIPRGAAAGSRPGRFIPTRVGNTRVAPSLKETETVHPHACGEYIPVSGGDNVTVGSSPRVWGIRFVAVDGLEYLRFIPTRVGNTTAWRGWSRQRTVHPHACGEYSPSRSSDGLHVGSSPRVWGIPLGEVTNPTGRRFIPTRVGNTHVWPEPRPRLSVHPHACGEYPAAGKSTLAKSGSSPRVWGIHTS